MAVCLQAGFAGERGGRRPVGSQEFSAVVFAGTASDAGRFKGPMVLYGVQGWGLGLRL